MLSVVIPVFNEEESLRFFWKELIQEIKNLDRNYEIIFVDDGSTDRSFDILKTFKRKDKRIRIFSFRKNQGKAEALTLGFQQAKGNLIVTLDADFQDRPGEIKKLLKKINSGWDLVSSWRKKRKDSALKVLSSKLFNSVSSFFWRIKLNDLNSGLKIYKKEAAKSLNLYGGTHRFIPLILYQQGFRVTEIETVHSKRKFGKSKYGFKKIFTEMPDMFTMIFLSKYSQRPLHFFGTVGTILSMAGFIILVYLTVLHFQGEAIVDRPLLLFGILLVLTGFQVFFTGFLADLFLHISQKNNHSKENMLKYETR